MVVHHSPPIQKLFTQAGPARSHMPQHQAILPRYHPCHRNPCHPCRRPSSWGSSSSSWGSYFLRTSGSGVTWTIPWGKSTEAQGIFKIQACRCQTAEQLRKRGLCSNSHGWIALETRSMIHRSRRFLVGTSCFWSRTNAESPIGNHPWRCIESSASSISRGIDLLSAPFCAGSALRVENLLLEASTSCLTSLIIAPPCISHRNKRSTWLAVSYPSNFQRGPQIDWTSLGINNHFSSQTYHFSTTDFRAKPPMLPIICDIMEGSMPICLNMPGAEWRTGHTWSVKHLWHRNRLVPRIWKSSGIHMNSPSKFIPEPLAAEDGAKSTATKNHVRVPHHNF